MKLVLIPGLDGTGDLFAPFVEALPAIDCQVIAYPPDREMDYAQHEAWVRDRLPSAGDYVLLAESFSGPVGVAIAAAPPAGLRGLILCCTFATNPLPVFGPLARLIAAFPAMRIPPALFAPFLYSGHGTAELRRAPAQAMAKVSPRALRARVAAILAVDYLARMREVQVPVRYLRATRDRLVPLSAFKRIKTANPSTELLTFEAPHFLLQTVPHAVASEVSSFLGHARAGAQQRQTET
jgi:pimeloyl-[acyl-carrier protein] methyl ester esterase